MQRSVPVHRLRPNDKVWTPDSVLFFDTETRTIPNTEPVIETLRLWSAQLVDRRPTKSGKSETTWAQGLTSDELADFIEQSSIGRPTLWIYAHNLGFDLVTTRLPMTLVARGWKVTDAAVGGKSPWIRFIKGRKRLTLVDSWSWLPVALKTIGEAVRIPKPTLPNALDSKAAWFARCDADVAILAAGMCTLMDWWDRNKLGRWNITGSSCGWNAFRHIPTIQRVVIDPDAAGRKADRAAIYGGRRGIWRVGELRAGPFLELDITAAYPTVAATMPLPLQRRSRFNSLPLDDWRIGHGTWGIIAWCTITTDTPRWPMRTKKGTWYPTGRFQAMLAGPDIAEAARLGALEAIGPGYVHQLGHVMQPWARWCLSVQAGRHDDAPDVARIAAKAWGRSVLGKWAGHSHEKTALGPSPVLDWGYEEGWDTAGQCKGGMVDLGGQRWWVAASGEPDNSYPAVYAWVESEVRVRLSKAIEAIGAGAVLQCDTDGLMVSETVLGTAAARGTLLAPDVLTGAAKTAWAVEALTELCAPLSIRVKRVSQHLTVLGPQHVITDAGRRFSGIPGLAVQGDDGKYRARIWPKLQWQMANGDTRGYVLPEIASRIKGPYATGWITSKGTVIPPEATITESGDSVLLAWHKMGRKPRSAKLADAQNPHLAALW